MWALGLVRAHDGGLPGGGAAAGARRGPLRAARRRQGPGQLPRHSRQGPDRVRALRGRGYGHRRGTRGVSRDRSEGQHRERALPIFEQIGNRLAIANVLHESGRVRLATGDVSEAAELLRRAMETFREVGDRHGQCEVLVTRGRLIEDTGSPDEASLDSLLSARKR